MPSKALDSFSTHLALTRSGSEENEKLQVLFEEWAGSEEDWSKSNLIIQMRSRNKHSKKGCRRWLTQREIADKYGSAEIAADIVRLKLEDRKARASTVRDHPDLPGREDMRQFLVFDYSEETDERDEILESLFSVEDGSDKDDVPTNSGRGRGHAKRKIPANPRRGDADPPLRPTAHPPAKAAALTPADLLTLQRLQRPRLRNRQESEKGEGEVQS